MALVRSIMIQGTGSNVGKSLVVAGLCRAIANRGLQVVPFKPQNMSNNAAVVDGGEIGRAQALQALACRQRATVDMNPILLKPEADRGSRVVVRGRARGRIEAGEFRSLRERYLPTVCESFARLACTGLVVVEGAGSPAEINLRSGDIANMGFAEAVGVPVILVGDIDRGGVIAQLAGCSAILPQADKERIRGFVVNKFRGEPALFKDGYREIEHRTGWVGLGVLPWLEVAGRLPAEDALDLRGGGSGSLHIAVPALSRIANFDDLDPLRLEPDVRLTIVDAGQPLPANADLVLLPGTKSTLGELSWFRRQGWDIDLAAHVRRGGRVMGICGGYQMLGMRVVDAEGVDGERGEATGLGLLQVETVMEQTKSLNQVEAVHVATGESSSGYEIHSGHTAGPGRARPVFRVGRRGEGASSRDGRICGTYIHGCFASDGFRSAWLRSLGGEPGGLVFGDMAEEALQHLAEAIEAHLNVDAILEIASQAQ